MILRPVFKLYIIHGFASLAVWLSTYYPGLDIIVSGIYMVIVGIEAKLIRNRMVKEILLIAVLWQVPGFFLSMVSSIGLWDLSDYSLFMLQFWYTPLMPLMSVLTAFLHAKKPLYYYLLFIMPLLMSSYYYLLAVLNKPKRYI